jgi:hypothetical protein
MAGKGFTKVADGANPIYSYAFSGIGHGCTSHISAAYSAMVRSLENFPELATFVLGDKFLRIRLAPALCGVANHCRLLTSSLGTSINAIPVVGFGRYQSSHGWRLIAKTC